MGSVRVLSDNRCIPIANHLRLAATQATGFTRARIPDLPFRVRHYRHGHAIGHPQGASHGRQLLMAS